MNVYNTHGVSENEYDEFLRFINEHETIDYDKLDEGFVNNFKLFDVPKDERFRSIEKRLDKIILTLPAIKRIFSKPIVHLKDKNEVVPTEAVRIINNYTLSHAMVHSELWDKTKSGAIKPKRLMTVEKTENYVTYENLIFCKAVDMILSFIKRTSLILKDIMYGCQELNFNLLDRTQHNSYFLAIGKLRKGYSNINSQYVNSYESCIKKIILIDKTIRPKLKSKVYLKCKNNSKNLSLKKTNAFRSHKDYGAIYNLLNFFENDFDGKENNIHRSTSNSREKYTAYCSLLSLFSILHFNFAKTDSKILNFKNLNEKFSFLGWALTLEQIEKPLLNALKFTFKKDGEYSICLVTSKAEECSESVLNSFKASFHADEYLFASSDLYGAQDVMYLSMYDIDSFRRIQQMILRGMIYSDKKQDDCAFCGSKMIKNESSCECQVCRARITTAKCEKNSKSYYVSEIVKYKSAFESSHRAMEKSKFLHDRHAEAQMHFRNITKITLDGEVICPHCGKVHFN